MQNYPSVETLLEKWAPILDHDSCSPIKDSYRRQCTAILLENQEKSNYEQRGLLLEAPTNAAGNGGFTGSAAGGGPVAGYDPVLISMIRRSMPKLMAYDLCGVQPLTGPSGLIFAMRSTFGTDRDGNGATPNVFENELFYNEAQTGRSADGGAYVPVASDLANNPGILNPAGGNLPAGTAGGYTASGGMSTLKQELLGDATGSAFREVGFGIEKILVEAKGRALKATYSLELQQDLKAVHGLDAESELANILSSEMLAEINREIVRTIYYTAVPGAQNNTAVQGQFDLDLDSNGRWSVERFKGLVYQIERDCNAVGQETRRGKANIMVCSADVASALALSKALDYTPAMLVNDMPDDTQSTFCGTLNGKIKVYVDPYSSNVNNDHFYVVGYKGSSPWDAGMYYSPYVGLQMLRATDPTSFQPAIGYKSRYALKSNPFSGGTTQLRGELVTNANKYYRRVALRNLQ